jgi:hypothetical protein
MIAISDLWTSTDHQAWKDALERYWAVVRPENGQLEEALEKLDV